MDTSELVRARDQLTYYGKFLEQLVSGVDAVLSMDSNHKTIVAEIPKLKDERNKLLGDIKHAQNLFAEMEEDHRVKMVNMTTALEAKSADLNKSILTLEVGLAKTEAQHKKRMEEINDEYGKTLMELKSAVAVEEAKLDALRRAKEAAKQAVEGL